MRLLVDKKKLQSIADGSDKKVESIVQKMAQDTEGYAKKSMGGSKKGRMYSFGGGRTHIASAPGEAPAIITGELRNSIIALPQPRLNKTWLVVVTAVYGLYLEFGVDTPDVKIDARPFMGPAIQKMISRIPPSIMEVVVK